LSIIVARISGEIPLRAMSMATGKKMWKWIMWPNQSFARMQKRLWRKARPRKEPIRSATNPCEGATHKVTKDLGSKWKMDQIRKLGEIH
jgi:hypothetical protein